MFFDCLTFVNPNVTLLNGAYRNAMMVSFSDGDFIYTNGEKLIDHLQSITEMCIPYKFISIRQSDLPWITLLIKSHIRKRKSAY